jgi:cytochrome P450
VNAEREPAISAANPNPAGLPTGAARTAESVIAELLSPAGRTDPYPRYAELHALGPVTRLDETSWVVSGYHAVNQVLRNPGFGILRPDESDSDQEGRTGSTALASMNRSILRSNPPAHGRMRPLMSSVFTARRVVELAPAIARTVDSLLTGMTAGHGEVVDFMQSFAFPLPASVICELLGVPQADRARFRPLAADLTEALEISSGEQLTAAAAAAAEELAGYFTDLVATRRARPSDDLVGALVAARDASPDRLDDEELLANLIMLLVAGFETTTSLLGNGLALLTDRPELLRRVRTGEVTVPGFVEEVLRFDSPVQLTIRVALTGGLEVAGAEIPRGAGLVLLIGAANRDPSRYARPDEFDPIRTDIRPLSFGAGPHTCLGSQLARLEATIAFERLAGRRLAAAPEGGRRRRERLVLRGYESLPILRPTSGSDPGAAIGRGLGIDIGTGSGMGSGIASGSGGEDGAAR